LDGCSKKMRKSAKRPSQKLWSGWCAGGTWKRDELRHLGQLWTPYSITRERQRPTLTLPSPFLPFSLSLLNLGCHSLSYSSLSLFASFLLLFTYCPLHIRAGVLGVLGIPFLTSPLTPLTPLFPPPVRSLWNCPHIGPYFNIMRLPTFSSLLCLAGLASVPVNGYAGDDPNIKSIPVGRCLFLRMRCRGTNLLGIFFG